MIPDAFFLLNEVPKELGYSAFIEGITSHNFGIDIFHDKPVIVRLSESFCMRKDFTDRINEQGFIVTNYVIRWLKENNITGKVVLTYKVEVKHWDIQIRCSAFKKDDL